jgi:hypothetical protein
MGPFPLVHGACLRCAFFEVLTSLSVLRIVQRVEVFGSKGMVQSANVSPNQCVVSTAESVHRDLPLNFFMDR